MKLKSRRRPLSLELTTHHYMQTLDHFTFKPDGYRTFPQRYLVNNTYWGGPQTKSPIFVCLGAESDIISQLSDFGIMTEHAANFKALIVFIEHRYYGTSMPFGSLEESYANASTLGYYTASQALADYAILITDLKKNLSANDCPVVVFGGSYGGMLAAWMRLKYPHITIGALASSAPILYLEDLTPHDAYDRVVTKDFRDASESCYQNIKASWAEMEKVASQPEGLKKLAKLFNTCESLSSWVDLFYWIYPEFQVAAQYSFPRVKAICRAINSQPPGTDNLTRLAAGAKYANGDSSCLDLGFWNATPSGWGWQTCTEMFIPLAPDARTTMFPSLPFDLKAYLKECHEEYGVLPRPHWVTTQFGGHREYILDSLFMRINLLETFRNAKRTVFIVYKRVLKHFGSNIIFSNGLRDPYSSGGVLENISKSIVAITTKQGVHCEDIISTTSGDPKWLKKQRSKEIKIIRRWIHGYEKSMTI
eukprot:PITA_10179